MPGAPPGPGAGAGAGAAAGGALARLDFCAACAGASSVSASKPAAMKRNVMRPTAKDLDYAPAGAVISGASYASTGTQLQNRCRSPYALSMRATGGQYFASASDGTGYAARSRE